MDRRWKFVVYGAGGYSGTLVCKYLAHDLKLPPEQWAIGGRSQGSITALLDELGGAYKTGLATFTADANKESLRPIFTNCRVVINCAGPFVLCGDAVVATCIETHTHYCDISGEPAFLRAMANAYHDAAVVARVKIVPCCGFDCVPADMGVQRVLSQCDGRLIEVDNYVTINSGMSSGTMQTALQSLSGGAPKTRSKAPKKEGGAKKTPAKKPRQWPHYSHVGKGWVLPFAVADPHVVLRSMTLQDHAFVYRHWLVVQSFWQFLKLVVIGVVVYALTRFRAGHRFIHNRLPSRQGPKQSELDTGSAAMHFVARTEQGETLSLTLQASHVYVATAASVVQAALCLHDGVGCNDGGVLTPATAFGGEEYRRRLNATGHLTF